MHNHISRCLRFFYFARFSALFVLYSFFGFRLQTNYMQSITFNVFDCVWESEKERGSQLSTGGCCLLFDALVPGSHIQWAMCSCSLSISIRNVYARYMRFIYTPHSYRISTLHSLSLSLSFGLPFSGYIFVELGNLWLYDQYFSSFIACGFWLFLYVLWAIGLQWLLLLLFAWLFYEIWIACTSEKHRTLE